MSTPRQPALNNRHVDRSALVYLFIGLFLLAILGYLYFQTRNLETERARRVVDELREITWLDAMLNNRLTEVTHGQLDYYDPLFRLGEQIDRHYRHLAAELRDLRGSEKEFGLALGMLQHTLADKRQHLQDLISTIALLKNSRAYLPQISHTIAQNLEQSPVGNELRLLLDDMLIPVLLYNLDGDRALRRQANARLRDIEKNLDRYPAALQPAILNLLTHARLLLQQTAVVNNLLRETLSLPVSRELNRLNDTWHAYHQRRLGQVDQYRLILFLLSALMLFYLLLVLVQLQRTTRSLHQALEEGLRTQQRMRLQTSALEAADNGIVITDQDGNIEWVNPAFTRMTGYSREEAIGQNPRLLKSGIHGERQYRELWDTILAGRVWRGEFVNKRKNGQLYHEEETITPVFDGRRGITHFVAIKQDISKRKQAEQALLRLNRSLQMLTSANQLLVHARDEQELLREICRIVIEDGDYRFAWVGYAEQDEERRVTPIAQAGFSQGYLDSLKISWADNEYGQGPTGTAIRTGQVSVIRDIHNDPRYRPWREAAIEQGYQSSIALPLRQEQTVLGALNIYSPHPYAFDEEEVMLLQELADDIAYGILALRNRKNYRDSQRQLFQAQKMEAIGHLTSGIAHDFNNILASIMGYTELALQRHVSDPDSKLAQYLREVQLAGKRARDLIDQMLSFSHDSGGDTHPLSLPPLVKEVVRMLDATLPDGIHIEIDPHHDGELPQVKVDPVQLHQIVMNLCINARDALDGRGRIRIRLRTVELEHCLCSSCHVDFSGPFVELAVEDNGGGIDPGILPHIFDPFFTTKDIGKGTGMGLATVHGLVHQYHGHVCVETVEGGGARFRILLPPATGEAQPAQQEPMVQANPAALKKQAVATACILIVEDDESIGRFLVELLESTGYRTRLCIDGESAWELFQEHGEDIDLVITDQGLPGISGHTLAKRIHARNPRLPIILCSANLADLPCDTVECECNSKAIRSCLQKPLSLPQLLDRVQYLLSETPA